MIKSQFVNSVVDIVVGLQFGSEGKGKIVSALTPYDATVRVGAPNAGHSIWVGDAEFKMQTIPCGWIWPKAELFIGPGGMVNMDILGQEMAMINAVDMGRYNVNDRLTVDTNAGVVTHEDAIGERNDMMYQNIGSTTEGIGRAMARKVRRKFSEGETPNIVAFYPEVQAIVGNVRRRLNQLVDEGKTILIEGTQGFGLCLNHGHYPFVTSRDVLASSMLSDCGLSPFTTREIIGVFRTYPIRVHGNSGPMWQELDWDQVSLESGYTSRGIALCEKTTVTKRVRRVGRIDWDMLHDAVLANRPTVLAMTFADYINADDRDKFRYGDLSEQTKLWIAEAERRLARPVKYVSTGPRPEHTIILY